MRLTFTLPCNSTSLTRVQTRTCTWSSRVYHFTLQHRLQPITCHHDRLRWYATRPEFPVAGRPTSVTSNAVASDYRGGLSGSYPVAGLALVSRRLPRSDGVNDVIQGRPCLRRASYDTTVCAIQSIVLTSRVHRMPPRMYILPCIIYPVYSTRYIDCEAIS